MAGMIVEELNQANKSSVYHKVTQFPLRIGRGYDNDLICNDDYVSARHLQIEPLEDGSGWRVTDCSSENGSYLAGGERIEGEAHIRSGDAVVIGDSRFVFYLSDHPVEPALKWHPIPGWVKKIGRPWAAWGTFVLFMLFVLFEEYLVATEPVKLNDFVTIALGLFILMLAWVGIWSLVGRVATHVAGFHRQLGVLAIMLLLSEPANFITEYAEFFSSSLLLGEIVGYVASLVLLALAIFYALAVATNMLKSRRVIASIVASVFVVALAFIGNMNTSSTFDLAPEYSSVVKPVSEFLLPTTSPEDFWKENVGMAAGMSVED